MKDIAIYGAGGYGREVACMLSKINAKNPTWNLIGFFDDGLEINSQNEYGKILGGIEELNNWKEDLSITIAIGSPRVSALIFSKITNSKVVFPNVISTDAMFSDINNFTVGYGNIIGRNCSFSCGVSIGNFNVFNSDCVIGHDTQILDNNILMPATRISGGVKVGSGNFFGVGSIVLQLLKIGDDIKLGAGSVLMTKPKNGLTYIGNPAKLFKF
ncbi:MAG: serine acetyltransferase [Rikenellaceae bacterium]